LDIPATTTSGSTPVLVSLFNKFTPMYLAQSSTEPAREIRDESELQKIFFTLKVPEQRANRPYS